MPTSITEQRLLRPAEVARFLDYDHDKPSDRVAFWRVVKAWRVPYFRIGPRTIRFKSEDFDGWLENRRVGRAPKGAQLGGSN